MTGAQDLFCDLSRHLSNADVDTYSVNDCCPTDCGRSFRVTPATAHAPQETFLGRLGRRPALVGSGLVARPPCVELYPRVGFISPTWRALCRGRRRLLSPARYLRAVHQRRQKRDQVTRPSRRPFAANVVRLQLHALAYNLGNFMRTLAMPKTAEPWSLTSLREKLIQIGAKVVSHGRYVTFQMAEVAVPRQMFAEILSLIARQRAPPAPA